VSVTELKPVQDSVLDETATVVPTEEALRTPSGSFSTSLWQVRDAQAWVRVPRWSVLGLLAATALASGLWLGQLAFALHLLLTGTVLAVAATRPALRLRRASAGQAGSYRLLRKLGHGGMGEVVLAEHTALGRPAAVKMLRPDKDGSLAALERFEWEVRAASGLSHPNTIAIYDFGRTGSGSFYYAMEYLQGLDLQALVDRHGPVPAARAVFILDQILASLGEAHRRGLLHRDVKPSNVFLTERGGEFDFVKVLDFGLAQEIQTAAAAGHDEWSRRGAIVGTPLYMAPEVFYGDQPVDHRSDLYAVGAVAYFLLTAAPLFEKRGTAQILIDQAKTQPVPPSARGARPSAELEALVLRTLSKVASERPASAEELREALRRTPEWGQWTGQDAAEWWTRTAPDVRANADRPISRPMDSSSGVGVPAAA
jgi:eukaryotic-like serine/threonine-protein kinase